MRQGYKLVKAERGLNYELKSPTGETIAELERHLGGYRLKSQALGIESDFIRCGQDLFETPIEVVEEAVEEIAEKHYKLPSVRWQRLNRFLGAPVWGWLFALLTLVIAGLSWVFRG